MKYPSRLWLLLRLCCFQFFWLDSLFCLSQLNKWEITVKTFLFFHLLWKKEKERNLHPNFVSSHSCSTAAGNLTSFLTRGLMDDGKEYFACVSMSSLTLHYIIPWYVWIVRIWKRHSGEAVSLWSFRLLVYIVTN